MKSIWFAPVALVLIASTANARPLSVGERVAIEKAIRKGLNDPESARFEHPAVPFIVGAPNGVVCGYVNSKNRMNGYTGNVPYMAAFYRRKLKPAVYEGEVVSIGSADPDSTSSQSIIDICAEKGFPTAWSK